MLTDRAVFIMAFDDIIANSSYDLYTYLCRNYSFYSKYLNVYKLYTKTEIYNRPTENLIEFLFNVDSYNRLTDRAKKMGLNNLYTILYSHYYNRDVAYNITPTKLANKFLKNPLFFENSGIDKVFIILKYHTDYEKKAKINFLKNNYPMEKIEIIPITQKDNYFDVIQSKIPNWNMVVIDDIKTIEKLASKNMDHKEIVMPRYGYNIIPPELVELIKQKSGTLSFYDLED